MKRLLMIFLTALMLAGCSGKGEPTEITEDTTPQMTESEYHYVADSSVEQHTDGAVRAYSLNADTYFGLRSMGSNLLIMGNKGLTVLSGEKGEATAKLQTGDIRVAPVIDTAATGMAYYLPNSRLLVILNPQLQTVTEYEMPKEIVGNPYISLVRNEIYYSTGSELRAMNFETGISRLLRQQTAIIQTPQGIFFDGTVLLCGLTDEEGKETLEFISTETGQTLGQGAGVLNMQTHNDQFIANWQDGTVVQTVFGTREGKQQSFMLPMPGETGGRAILAAINGVIEYEHTDSGLSLSFYDLTSGKLTSQVVLPDVQSPADFCYSGTAIWMLATDAKQTAQALYQWDITKTVVEDKTVHTGPLYTAENPDKKALKECQKAANTFQGQYGVKVLFWENAVPRTGGYVVKPEHHSQVIYDMMEKMKPVVEQFPKNFLLKTVEAGWIKIALVQSIEGADWAQFWEDGDCWILLTPQADVESALIQGIAYGIDSHVLGNSRDYDTWQQLNPKGFSYTYSEKADENSRYLSGSSRAFADAQAMTYPHEDRSRIFYYAMRADNAEMFQSSIMQAKLLRVCEGIREAYDLEKKTDVYAWEQYLTKSIAYTKTS